MVPYYSDELVTIYHGDCRDVLPTLESGSVDLVLTDPPYGLDMAYGRSALGGRSIAGDADLEAHYAALSAYPALLRDDRWCVFFCGYQTLADAIGPLPDLKMTVKSIVIWDKMMPSLGDGIRNQYEAIVLARQGRPVETYTGGNVWQIPRIHGRPVHPNEKPLRLISRLINYYSASHQTILDPFAGSGSTAVAAKILRRRCIAVEISEEWAEIAANRCRQTVMQFDEPTPQPTQLALEAR